MDSPFVPHSRLHLQTARSVVAILLIFGASVKLSGADCNTNGVSDTQDIRSGSSPDCNVNGLPDECEFVPLRFGVRDQPMPIAKSPQTAVVADLNDDGVSDLVVGHQPSLLRSLVSVILGQKNGTPAAAVEYEAGAVLSSVATADLDLDGDLDIVTANISEILVFVNNGDGSLAKAPGVHQGVHLETNRTEVESLLPNIRNKKWTLPQQRRQLDLVRELNDQFGRQRANEAALDARIQSFELAYRMQMAASDAFDLSKEPAFIHDLYGKGFQGRQMLTARRLVERGVRVVQVYHGGNQPWDSHEDIEREHRRLAGECDQAIGALLKDLKQRGLLDETLVLWGGEFGRTPVVELAQGGNNFTGKGRDHNHHGFSVWLAGGGVKGGTVYGATDEFGFKAVENRMHVHDLHATILHLMGIDHEQLTYRYSGRDFRLTDVSGTVAHEIFT